MTKKSPPAARAVRYWFLNGTTIVLEVPYEKIGVPFEKKERAVELTDSEKTKIVDELSKCEAHIRTGNLEMLEFALEICNRCALPLPGWLLPYILEAINRLLRSTPRARQDKLQREIHQIRWATVHHLRTSQRLTLEDAFAAASEQLYRTRARGSEETIRASYKWMNRHPFINALRQNGLEEVNDFAREQYNNKQVASERLIAVELRDRKKPKYW